MNPRQGCGECEREKGGNKKNKKLMIKRKQMKNLTESTGTDS